MLYVKTPEEVLAMIDSEFAPLEGTEVVSLRDAMGRILAEDIAAREYVPDFDRSTVDGFAVRASDTFGLLSKKQYAPKAEIRFMIKLLTDLWRECTICCIIYMNIFIISHVISSIIIYSISFKIR